MSAQLNFQSAAFLNLAFVFLGAFFASLACILCGTIFKKKYFKVRLSLCFALLSAAIVFASLFVIKEQTQSAPSFSAYFKDSALAAAFYFCAGFLCSASLKIIFPIAALLYIAWTLSFGIFLYKKMPLPQSYSITVGESFTRDDASGAQWTFSPSGEGACLDWTVYEMNKNALLPLPHYWHALVGARAFSEGANGSPGEAPDVLEDSIKEQAQDSGAKSFLNRLFYKAAKALLGKPRLHSVRLAPQQLYPVIFEARVKSDADGFAVDARKIM